MKHFSIYFLCFIIVLAVLAPLLFDYDPYFIDLSQSFSKPSWLNPFGLDEDGKGLLIQVIYGLKMSLGITFSVIFLSLAIGLSLGTLAGYLESWTEIIIMSVVDLVLAFPKFLMALALVAMLGSSVFHLIFALTFSTWAGFARLTRAELKHLKKKEFVLQARSVGANAFFLIFKHLWPNLMHVLFIHAVFQAVAVLIAESGLSFLGLGVSLENPSLGSLLGQGRNYIFSAPHIIFFPSLVLFLFLLSLNNLGESLRGYFDPHKL